MDLIPSSLKWSSCLIDDHSYREFNHQWNFSRAVSFPHVSSFSFWPWIGFNCTQREILTTFPFDPMMMTHKHNSFPLREKSFNSFSFRSPHPFIFIPSPLIISTCQLVYLDSGLKMIFVLRVRMIKWTWRVTEMRKEENEEDIGRERKRVKERRGQTTRHYFLFLSPL